MWRGGLPPSGVGIETLLEMVLVQLSRLQRNVLAGSGPESVHICWGRLVGKNSEQAEARPRLPGPSPLAPTFGRSTPITRKLPLGKGGTTRLAEEPAGARLASPPWGCR